MKRSSKGEGYPRSPAVRKQDARMQWLVWHLAILAIIECNFFSLYLHRAHLPMIPTSKCELAVGSDRGAGDAD